MDQVSSVLLNETIRIMITLIVETGPVLITTLFILRIKKGKKVVIPDEE